MRLVANAWTATRDVRTASGLIGPLGDGTSPAITEFIATNGTTTLYGVFPSAGLPATTDDDGGLRVYAYDDATDLWAPLPWQPNQESTIGKPGIAVVPVDPASPMPGKVYLMYMKRHATKTRVRETSLTVRSGPAPRQIAFLSPVDHDNTWFYGFGVDLVFERGVDTNLRALIASRTAPGGVDHAGPLQLRWSADGAIDFAQRDWDDWRTLGRNLCRSLRGPMVCEP